jgi:hypothetical protein
LSNLKCDEFLFVGRNNSDIAWLLFLLKILLNELAVVIFHVVGEDWQKELVTIFLKLQLEVAVIAVRSKIFSRDVAMMLNFAVDRRKLILPGNA